MSNGDVVYFDGTDWKQADADAESTGALLIGISLGYGEVFTRGVWTIMTGFTPLTPGDMYYVSTVAGEMTNVMPEGTGDIVRIIGYALSTTQLFFRPDNTYIEVL